MYNFRKSDKSNQKRIIPMKICSINIGGFSEKSRFLIDKYTNDEDFDIVTVQETCTTDKDKLKVHNMTSYCDSNQAKNRGATIFVKNEIPCSKIPEISNITNNLDSVWILVVVGGKRYIVGNVYINHHYDNAIVDVIKMLDQANSSCRKMKALGVILCGDFNARHTFWNDSTCNKNGRTLLENLQLEHFSIINPENPTFLCKDGSSFIDLFIISNNLAEKIESCTTNEEVELNSGAPLRGHLPVIMEVSSEKVTSKGNIKHKLDVDSIDWKKWSSDLNNTLLSNFNSVMTQEDPQELWNILEKAINHASVSNAKMKKVCSHSKPFWTPKLTQLCNEMRAARKAYQKRNTDDRKDKMVETKERFDEARIEECQNFIMNKTTNLNTAQAKSFWKKFNSLFKKRNKPGIDPLQVSDGSFLTSSTEIEEKMFETFFQCKHMVSGDFDQFFYNTINNLYNDVKNEDIFDDEQIELNAKITMMDIRKAIKSTDINKTSLDNFNMHPKMLAHLGDNALHLLEKLFNLCLEKGKWVWNTASGIFLRKAGKKTYSIPGAYRPICITSYIGKLLEKILAARLSAFLEKKKHLDPTQEGFTANRNAIRYLNRLHLEIKADLEEHKTVIALFADMEKAFDSVWKRGLIVKMTKLKIQGKVIRLIDDFLQSRIVQLHINGFEGDKKETEEYGLPQGSALSPVLFKIYMIDLLEDLKDNPDISLFKFADDGTVKIRGNDNQECIAALNLVTKSLYEWSNKWRMIINCDPNKTEYLCFGSNETSNPIPESVKIGQKDIKRVSKTKVLGLTVDEKLTFMPHCEEVNKRLLGKWAEICKYCNTQWGFNQRVITRIIQTIFISIMQYAGHIWLNSKTLSVINRMWYKLVKSAVGATFNLKLETGEMILGLPPVKLQTSINRTKHYLKINITQNNQDLLKESVKSCLAKRTPPAEINDTFREIFKFLKWKQKICPQNFNQNDMEIISSNNFTGYFDLSSESCKYTKGAIRKFTEYLWASSSRNQQLYEGELAYATPSCKPLPIPTNTNRSDEVLLMSIFYPNNLMNSFVYRHTYNTESPLCSRCHHEEESAYHVIMQCNNHLQIIRNIVYGTIGEASAQVEHHNTLLNCSREPQFLKCALEILNDGNYRRSIEGIIPAP